MLGVILQRLLCSVRTVILAITPGSNATHFPELLSFPIDSVNLLCNLGWPSDPLESIGIAALHQQPGLIPVFTNNFRI